MNEVLFAFGRGVVKTLISVFVGAGVGLVTFGTTVDSTAEIWVQPGPPAQFFVALGAAMLSSGVIMTALFLVPRVARASALRMEKGEPVEV